MEKHLGYESQKQQWTTILNTCSIETPLSFYMYISQTERDKDTKLKSIDFSHWGTEGFKISWLPTLGDQLIDHSLYIRYTVY